MVSERGRKRLPPYVSYRTFRNFMEGLQQRMPARIDRSYWGDMLSGSTGTQLMAALRFLNLIDDLGRPTGSLKPLATAKGDQRVALLRDLANESFDFVFDSSLDPQNATYSQLEEIFRDKYQLTGDLSRKCLKFFIELTNDAGITLSPFITKRFRSGHAVTGTKPVTKKAAARTFRHQTVPQKTEEMPAVGAWDRILLTKFPTFDPGWSEELKLKWFNGFDELLRHVLTRGEK